MLPLLKKYSLSAYLIFCYLFLSYSAQAIMGGTEAGQPYSWMVSLQKNSNEDEEPDTEDEKAPEEEYNHLCGGVLIAPQWVVTAGHCVTLFMESDRGDDAIMAPENISVLLGAYDLSSKAESGIRVPVQRIIRHPEYATFSSVKTPEGGLRKMPSTHYDIALLHLSQSVALEPISLISATSLQALQQHADAGNVAMAAMSTLGWGMTMGYIGLQLSITEVLNEIDKTPSPKLLPKNVVATLQTLNFAVEEFLNLRRAMRSIRNNALRKNLNSQDQKEWQILNDKIKNVYDNVITEEVELYFSFLFYDFQTELQSEHPALVGRLQTIKDFLDIKWSDGSLILKKLDNNLVLSSKKDCKEDAGSDPIALGMLCVQSVGPAHQTVCSGDSGGPLFTTNNGFELVGVTSGGNIIDHCSEQNALSYFTNINVMRSFIEKHVDLAKSVSLPISTSADKFKKALQESLNSPTNVDHSLAIQVDQNLL